MRRRERPARMPHTDAPGPRPQKAQHGTHRSRAAHGLHLASFRPLDRCGAHAGASALRHAPPARASDSMGAAGCKAAQGGAGAALQALASTGKVHAAAFAASGAPGGAPVRARRGMPSCVRRAESSLSSSCARRVSGCRRPGAARGCSSRHAPFAWRGCPPLPRACAREPAAARGGEQPRPAAGSCPADLRSRRTRRVGESAPADTNADSSRTRTSERVWTGPFRGCGKKHSR